MKYDAEEPLDAAGAILRGFGGGPKRQAASVSENNPLVQMSRFKALVGL